MTRRTISDAVTNIRAEYIEKAADYSVKKRSHRPIWIKLGTMAACLAVIAVVGVGLLQGGLFGNRTDVATLDNGNKIIFVKSDTVGGSLSLAIEVDIRQLTEEEVHSLFADLPVTAHAIYKRNDMDAGDKQDLIGFEGKIGNAKLIISTISDMQLIDTVIDGSEESTEINGTTVTAGYFVTDPNSKGEQNTIYYAAFELGNCKVYLENAGTIDDSETTKNQLAKMIEKLTENGEFDLTLYIDSEVGTELDGNPSGYDQLPDNQTFDEEVSEQDPAAN